MLSLYHARNRRPLHSSHQFYARRSRNRLIGASVASVAAIGGLLLSPQAAHASLACDATRIVINDGPGGENATYANGHEHNTGNHYVRRVYPNRVWEWWADNNGGFDGDTADTLYGRIQC